jgi:hypothetical protein
MLMRREQAKPSSNDRSADRFARTLRNLLSTPPKPHGANKGAGDVRQRGTKHSSPHAKPSKKG